MDVLAQRNLLHFVNSKIQECQLIPSKLNIAVALVLFSRNRHLSAEKIHTLVEEKGCTTSRAAIYNTLALFVEKGLIRQIIVGQGNTYYISNTPSCKIREIYTAYNTSLKANRTRQFVNPQRM